MLNPSCRRSANDPIAVFLDFDNTISDVDVTDVICAEFAKPKWAELNLAYLNGQVGSRQALIRMCELIDDDSRSGGAMESVLSRVTLDSSLSGLAAELRRRSIPLAIVSDGFGFYIPRLVALPDVSIYASELESASLKFPHGSLACENCGLCGTCKVRPLAEAAARGYRTVYVGDGYSDLKAAEVADVVFAKGALRKYCATLGIDHYQYRSLADVLEWVVAEDASGRGP